LLLAALGRAGGLCDCTDEEDEPASLGSEAIGASRTLNDCGTRDRRFYRPVDGAHMPLEFADAAYRYGHGQIRHRYHLNGDSEPVPLFPDLIGFRPVVGSLIALPVPGWRGETPLWYYILREPTSARTGTGSGPSAAVSSARCSSACSISM
jgi:hypothetical protein